MSNASFEHYFEHYVNQRRPPENNGGQALSPYTVLIALRCWWHLALPLGLLLASITAVVVHYTSVPTYTASAWVLIRERPINLITNSSQEDSRKYVQNQIELMRSPPVLDPVASEPSVASTPELADQLDPVMSLRNKLRIRSLGQSDYFEIVFTSKSPEKASLIVNKVSQAYLDLQQRSENKSTQRTIELLQEQHVAQQQEVKRLRDKLEVLSKQIYGREAFPIEKKERPSQPNPLADMQSQLIKAEVEQAALAAQIEASQELLLKESFEPPLAVVESEVQAHPRVKEAKSLLEQSKRKLEEWKRRATNPKNNSLYPSVERQVQDDEAALERTLAEARADVKAALEKNGRARRQDHITELRAQAQSLNTTVDFLKGRLRDQRGEQQAVAGDSLQYEFVRADYDRANEFLDAIASRILTMQTEQRAPERVEIFRDAKVPARADEDLPLKRMSLMACAAFFAPFALAILVELLYRRVSNRQHVESIGQLAVIGEVTTLPTRLKSRRIAGQGLTRERQLFEESIDGLRTLLALIETTKTSRVLAVTSAISREGKTSLAAQLAVSVASATNRPTLLIDGDMRSPDLHRIFDIDLSPGLCEVLKGECNVEEALETGFSETLHLLTAGNLNVSPHRLLGGNKFADLVMRLRDIYDFIIIDTPPILPASEALLLANAADAAILCARRDFSRVDQMSEAFQRLRSSGARIVGAVLNGIPPQQYAYRYGSYYYNRPMRESHAPAGDAATSSVT